MKETRGVPILLAMKNDQLVKTLIQVLGALALQIITARAAANKAADMAIDESTGIAGSASHFKGGDRMRMNSEDEDMSSFLPGLLIGGIIGALFGAAAALWFAPQSGEQTQEKIRQEAIRLKQSADETLGEVKSSIDSAAGQARDKAESAIYEGQQFVNQQAEKASQTASNLQNKVTAR